MDAHAAGTGHAAIHVQMAAVTAPLVVGQGAVQVQQGRAGHRGPERPRGGDDGGPALDLDRRTVFDGALAVGARLGDVVMGLGQPPADQTKAAKDSPRAANSRSIPA